MKNILTTLAFLITSIMAFGQTPTPFAMISSHDVSPDKGYAYGPKAASATSSSIANAWYGGSIGMNFKGDASNSILVNARAMYLAIYGENYAIPLVTNVGFDSNDSLSTKNAFELGIRPYYIVNQNERLKLLLHGAFNYAIPDLKNTDATEFNLLIGAEVALYPNEGGLPFTLSIAPEYSMSIQDTNDNGWGLGIEGVIPITGGMGILLNTKVPFDNSLKTDFNIGLILNGAIN